MTGVAVRAENLGEPAHARTVARVFGSVTPENELKWESTQPRRGAFSFEPADRIVRFATREGIEVRGHTLVWHLQLPAWVEQGDWTRDELVEVMREHIRTVVRRYRGRIGTWDVVNEAMGDDGHLRESVFLRVIGPEYIALAFRAAREADPDAKLFYNDYGAEQLTGKGDAVHTMLRGLLRAGVPIDGVGLQAHVTAEPLPELEEQMRRLAGLGLRVELTELDVRVPDGSGDEGLARQASAYGRIVRACLAVARCARITFWGLSDAQSFAGEAYPGFGRPLLFDEELDPKPAYGAVREALHGGG